jgi:putative flippase GtrA
MPGSLALQFASFALLGVLNTILDFLLYNLFTRAPFRWSRIQANLLSTTVAMAFSYTMNHLFVFSPATPLVFERALRFLVVTAFGLYVVQNFVIYLASKLWLAPVRLSYKVVKSFHLTHRWSEEFVSKNIAKLLATFASLLWNFLWYRFYVFAE